MDAPTLPSRPALGLGAPGRRLLPQYGRFLLGGLTGVAVNLIVFSLGLAALTGRSGFDVIGGLTFTSTHSGVDVRATLTASAAAFVVATLWNYALNSAWTFRTREPKQHSAGHRLGLYYLVSLGSLGVNELILFLLVLAFPPLYGQGAGILAGSVVGYWGNRRFTFASATTSH